MVIYPTSHSSSWTADSNNVRALREVNGMSMEQKPVAAFALGLVAGVFILLGSIIMFTFTFGNPVMAMSGMGGMGMMGSMMSGTMASFNGAMAVMLGYSFAFRLVGLASGALVVVGSVMLYNRPSESQTWSAVILAFSLLSIVGAMGGFMVGLVIGVLGGILGLVWKPSTSSQIIGPHRRD